MATLRQKKLAEAIIENVSSSRPKNKQQLVESAGYSELTADRVSKEIIESKGVQESLVSLGFTSDKAKKVVAEILDFGENDLVKLKAADMIFKVHGTYAPTKAINLGVEYRLNDEELKKTADELLRLQKDN